MSNYCCYHLHTEDSLLDSCTNYKLYVDKAVELGQTAIGFSEHGNIYNWVEKKIYCDKKGIKYIHGCEVYLTEQLEPKVRDNFHTILIGKNEAGRKELNMLVGRATDPEHMYYKPRLSFDEFFNISDNVIKISACLQSPLNKFKQIYDLNQDKERQQVYLRLLKTYDYYEIQPHVNSEDQKKYNVFLYKMSQKFHKPLIAATDTHSLNQYKAECRSILMKAKHIEFQNEDQFDLTYKSYDELVDMFKQQGVLPIDVVLEAIENTNRMADSVEDFKLDTTIKYPKTYDTPEEEERALKQTIREKLKYKLDNGIIKKENLPIYKKNIMEEMHVFKQINMIGFMLFMSRLICWCKDNGIPVGYGRGSVGGSTVAFITDIIDEDPVVWHTVFSRFANINRVEQGDIDVDISPDQRDKVYEHIITGFGVDKTAYILSMGTISDKGTIDEIGRALNIPLSEVASIKEKYSEIKSRIDTANSTIKDLKQSDIAEDDKRLIDANNILTKATKDMDSLQKKEYPTLFYYFKGLNGTAISQSYHPAGIIVSPITLPDNVGTFINNEGKHVTYINMDELHFCNYCKYDILGLKTIMLIRKCCEYADIPYPKSYQIDWNDQNVWDDMPCTNAGLFQCESSFAFAQLAKFRPKNIFDMCMLTAALRPSGASYRDRLLNGEWNKNPSPMIDSLLEHGHGFLIYQEDTTRFLTDICGFDPSEADSVRRAIGHKDKAAIEVALPKILNGYCKSSDKPRDVAEKEARQFLKIIEASASYQFGYNHSVEYSMLTYTCAYMRYYYPEEFTAAYLNCANNDDDIRYGTDISRVKHIKIENIKFGKSGAEYTVDKKNHTIYKGIASIKFCNSEIAKALYSLSQQKTYTNFVDLLQDMQSININSRQLEILITLNFFSAFGKNATLLETVKIFNSIYDKKVFKKDSLSGMSEDLICKYAEKETEKQYRVSNTLPIIKEFVSNLEDKSIPIQDQLKAEQDYLGYITTTYPDMNDTYYYVQDYKTFSNALKPYVTLYQLKTGDTVKTKIKNPNLYKESPFGQYDIVSVTEFTQMNKFKKVNGEYVKSDEKEDVITEYQTIVKTSH